MENGTQPAGLESREIALAILQKATSAEATLDDALAANEQLAALEPRDRAFVRLLTATTLRRRGQIDALLKTYLRHPLPRRANRVRMVLRISAAQLLFLKTPPHAVVDNAVRMCRRFPGQKGLVNAVLRRVSEDGEDRLKKFGVALNTPRWLWESWVDAYGPDTATDIASAHMADPPLDITAGGDPSAWEERLGGRAIAPATVRIDHAGEVSALPGYDEGAWWVQDYAAALPAQALLKSLPNGGSGANIIDLCAAPGGKTAQLAKAGAQVTAIDRSDKRLNLLRQNMDRLGLEVAVQTGDARRWKPDTPADGVLLDAPCSATGTIRRHPDLPFSKREEDVERMAKLQKSLADAALQMVKPGGVVIYSVCSLQPEEGEDIAAALVAGQPGFSPIDLAGLAPEFAPFAGGKIGALRTLPCHMGDAGGMDGFYIFGMRRDPA